MTSFTHFTHIKVEHHTRCGNCDQPITGYEYAQDENGFATFLYFHDSDRRRRCNIVAVPKYEHIFPRDCICGSWLMDGFIKKSCPVKVHPDLTDNDGVID